VPRDARWFWLQGSEVYERIDQEFKIALAKSSVARDLRAIERKIEVLGGCSRYDHIGILLGFFEKVLVRVLPPEGPLG